MLRYFKGTCEAIRAMHDYRAPVGSKNAAFVSRANQSRHAPSAPNSPRNSLSGDEDEDVTDTSSRPVALPAPDQLPDEQESDDEGDDDEEEQEEDGWEDDDDDDTARRRETIRYDTSGGGDDDEYDDDTNDENDDTNDTTRHGDSEGSDPFELCAGKGKLGFCPKACSYLLVHRRIQDGSEQYGLLEELPRNPSERETNQL